MAVTADQQVKAGASIGTGVGTFLAVRYVVGPLLLTVPGELMLGVAGGFLVWLLVSGAQLKRALGSVKTVAGKVVEDVTSKK